MTMYISNAEAFASWLETAKNGDSKVWDDLYRVAIPWIKDFAKKNRVDRELAEDFMQESTIIFFEQVMDGRLTKLTCEPKYYLYSIFKIKWMEYYRKNKDHVRIHFDIEEIAEELPEMDSLALDIDQHDLHTPTTYKKHLQRAFENLGNKCRELLQLAVYADVDMSEVARRLGYKNAHTASNQKYRCIQELKKLVIA